MTDNLRGILAILASATAFVVNDALVKLATEELPTGEIIVVRGIMATLILGFATTIAGAWRSPHILLRPAMAIRIASAAMATVCIVAALRYLPLATSSAILQVTPLMVTAGAAVLLKAPVGWRRWLASLAGFGGVLLIVKPGTETFVKEVWIALAALLFTSARDLTTRFVDHDVPSLLVAFASSFVITLAGLTLWPFETWVMPSTRAMTLLGGAAVCLYFAYYLGIVAMRIGEIAVVAPFRYSLVILALILSYVVWGHLPDQVSMLGIAIICGAGIYLLHRERVRARHTKAAAAAKEQTA
ncbi:MAG: DMT family transporter [Hyphomicrobiaceae bacterium]